MLIETIYVKLAEEAVDAWRPVQAEVESDVVFRLPEQAPDDEDWAFPPGSLVQCEWRQLSDGAALVATALAARRSV